MAAGPASTAGTAAGPLTVAIPARADCGPAVCTVRVTLRAARPVRATLRWGTRRLPALVPRGRSTVGLQVPRTQDRIGVSVAVAGRVVASRRVALVPVPAPAVPAPPSADPPALSGDRGGDGPRLRAVIAVPAGGDAAAAAALVPAVRHEIDVVTAWFAGQTANGARPRWRRTTDVPGDGDGLPVVSVVPIPHTAAQIAAAADPPATVSDDVAGALPAAEGVDVVWVDAVGDGSACGVTGAAVVLWQAACGIRPSTTSSWPYGGTYLLAHEMTHALGAAGRCAPHTDGGGHVTDDPRDVIYQGPQPRTWAALALDPGRDDYFGTPDGSCDIAASPLWSVRPVPAG